jgi:outer membrane receptor for ferrienterochelin and colicins
MTRIHIALVTFSLSAALPVPAFATDDESAPLKCAVSGIARDVTGLPLPGVAVTLRSPTAAGVDVSGASTTPTTPAAPAAGGAVVTNDRGQFCVRGDSVVAGSYTLDASLEGFVPLSERVTITDPARAVTIDLSMHPAFRSEVVVTGTRTSRRLDDVPVRTEVVGQEMIKSLSARTLADAVEYTTGVRVESNCQNCNFSQIRLLGLEGPYTQILVDGQPIISSLAQVYGIEQIPTRMIERIEVVKGGGSALYGPGSVGGVINIIPREAPRSGGLVETRTELTEGLPNYSFNGAADWVSADRRTLVTAFGQVDRVKPLDVSGDGFTEVARRNLDAFGGRVNRYLLDGRAKLTADVTSIREDRRGGDLLRLRPEQATIAEWIDTNRLSTSATWFHSVSKRFDYRLTFAAADTSRDSYYGTNQDPNAFGDTENSLYIVDSQINQYVGKHTLSWGGQFSSDDLVDRQPAYDRLTDATYRNAGVFAQDDWVFAKGWELLYGVRVDKHSAVDRAIASPRVALMYSPTPALDVRMSVARGFRAPQAFDEDLHLSSVGGEVRFIRLSPALKEETSTNLMLGAEWKPELGPGQGLFEVNGFSTTLDDLFNVQLDDDPLTDPVEMLKVNFGRARVYGVEMNAGWGIGDTVIFQGGIVLQRARFGEDHPDFGGRDFFRTPERYGNVSMTVRSERIADVFVGMRYTGPMKAPHYAGFISENRLEITRSFVTFDASVSRALATMADGKRLVLTLGARNLTDAYQPDIDQGPLRDSDYVYGPRFPRSFTFGLRAEF